MKKILQWSGIVIGLIVVLVLAFYTVVHFNISHRANKTYSFAPEILVIPNDSGTLAMGHHLVQIKGCTDCHGANMAGKVMIDDPALGRIVASNITIGEGGLPQNYSTADWIMSLRHGVNRLGKPLLLMPSHESTLLTTKDMAAIIAYCQQLPAVNNKLPENKLGPVVKLMSFLGKMPLLSVEKIDHDKPMVELPEEMTLADRGQYLAISCKGCHRDNMKGGEPLAPGFPPVPDITLSGLSGKWSHDQFETMLRTGKTPEGRQINSEDMPWKMTAQYTDEEIESLYAYLHSLK